MVSRGRRPSAAEGEVWAEEDSAAEEAPNGSKPRARPRAALSRRRSAIKANEQGFAAGDAFAGDRKSTRLNSSHVAISYAVFCLKKKNKRTSASWLRASAQLPYAPTPPYS